MQLAEGTAALVAMEVAPAQAPEVAEVEELPLALLPSLVVLGRLDKVTQAVTAQLILILVAAAAQAVLVSAEAGLEAALEEMARCATSLARTTRTMVAVAQAL